MKKAKKSQRLNDGYVWCYSVKEKNSIFAPEQPHSTDELNPIVSLAYSEESKRDQDYEFAESLGRTLSYKIRTLIHNDVKKTSVAVIENTLYGILKIDYNRSENVMYLYLEEVGPIAR